VITPDSKIAAVLGDSKKGPKFAKLGIATVGDLLDHHPRRYIKTGELTAVDLRPGQMILVVGRVAESVVQTYRDRRTGRTAYRVDVTLATGRDSLKMSFFAKHHGQAEWQQRRLSPGTQGVFTGQVSSFRGEWQLTHPDMALFGDDDSAISRRDLPGLFPVYPLTKGLQTWDVLRGVEFALSVVDPPPEVIPEAVRREHGLVDKGTALRRIHRPDDYAQVDAARRYFRFEEALVSQLVMARSRAALRALGSQARTGGGGLLAAFDDRLPFTLTADQARVGAEIEADLAQPHPMHRLLQGEVGSGKTLVALRAMLRVVDSGGQAALLAPTEVLAQQHHRSITEMLGDLAMAGLLGGAPEATFVELLTGSMTKTQRTEPLLRLASGEAGIVIGTHALLEDQVSFADLGLVVVDEQHRFGVEQRAALNDKSLMPPHVLVMTATPIPRTVAMTVFGDLEVSSLTELPAGRAPIQTNVVPLAEQPHWIDRVWQRVREEVDKGHQVYLVSPRIVRDESEAGQHDQLDVDEEGNLLVDRVGDGLSSVEDLHADLAEGSLAGLRLAMLHGRLPADDKDRTMRAFAAGDIDVLVSTTVIEVGVDVANATMMVILDADRFGVSQLHQLRGRVGRGGHHGLCLLVTHAPADSPARGRLDAVAATTDGFELARVDLEARREGDVLGARQSGGRSSLQRLRVLRDEDTIVEARGAAEALLAADPDLTGAPELRAAVDALESSVKADYMEKS
jgi:ATP-dependent DNA helicase RecG